MALKTEYDSIDAIPESARGAYVQKGDKFVLDAEIEDVSGLKASQRRLLDEQKRTASELESWRKIVGDRKPEDIDAILRAQQAADEERQKKAGEFDKLLEKRVNETKAEYEKRIAELSPYKQKYEDRELEIAIREGFVKAGGVAEDLAFVIPIVKGSRIKLDEKSGKPVVIDADGDATGLSVEKFFAETFKSEAPKFYQGVVGSGGGASAGASGARVVNGAAANISDFVADITTNKGALDKALAGQYTLRG